ncbi:MAG: flagellar motor switch protein FliN [Planctomycetota bacterium]|jgi:flagellar motor switch protein FliN/FliY
MADRKAKSTQREATDPGGEAVEKDQASRPEEGGAISAGEGSAEQSAEAAMEHAQQAMEAIKAETGAGAAEVLNLPEVSSPEAGDGVEPAGLALLRDVNLQVKVELGRTRMYVEDVLRLNQDSVIELDKLAGDPVDIFVNDRHVARGEVLVVNDNFCVRVSEIIQPVGPED